MDNPSAPSASQKSILLNREVILVLMMVSKAMQGFYFKQLTSICNMEEQIFAS